METIKTKTNKPKFVIYARKSSEDNSKQVHSIDAQIFVMKDIAKHEGIQIVEIFQESKSAKEPGRPVFNKMIEQFKKNKYDGILCWKIDRLARNPVDAGIVQWLLQKNSIQQIITSDRKYNPEDNVIIASVEFGMSNQYILDLSKNVKRGLAEKVRRGEYPGPVPLGYLRDFKTKKIILDPDKAHYIKRAYQLYSTGLYSIDQLTEKLNNEGLRSLHSQRVQPSIIGRMLNNPIYYGWFEWKGQLCPGKHAPIISKDIFDKVDEIMFPQRVMKRKDKRKFTFRGLLRCGECGLKITAEVRKGHTYYRCTKSRGTNKCSQRYVREEALDEEINRKLSELNFDPEVTELAILALKDQNRNQLQQQIEIQRKNEELLRKNRESQDILVNRFLDNLVPEDIYNRRLTGLRNDEARLDEIIQNTKDNTRNAFDKIETIVRFSQLANEIFTNGTPVAKKEVAGIISSDITLKDRKILDFSLDVEFQWMIDDMNDSFALNHKIAILEPVTLALEKAKAGIELPAKSVVRGWPDSNR
ncbi:MAG: recombinase family protein [Candidatus Moranbacteria bacterium]|nr:recombinase family protein [Candidatus Moranbacteria bacterium]